MRSKIKERIESKYEKVVSVCKNIYDNPEIALQEFHASQKLKELLKEEGFTIEENCSNMPTAFKATKKNGNGPRVAIMAEYDALPEIGHACGHHLIAGMSVLAGIALSEILEKQEGEVSVFGTPAEETGDGKANMVRDGYFDEYDIGIMLHPCGITCVNPVISAIGVYDFTFHGKASHAGAAPYDGINALDAVVLMYNGISVMRQQLKDGSRVAGIILSGGAVSNSIPDLCTMRYEIRSTDMDYYYEILEKVNRCAKGAAEATGCTMEWIQSAPTCSTLVPSSFLVEEFRKLMKEFGVLEDPQMNLGSTDMGEVNEVIPTVHPLMKMVENGEAVHTADFRDASILPYAWDKLKEYSEMLALLGLRIFEDPALLEELRKEREEKRWKRKNRR